MISFLFLQITQSIQLRQVSGEVSCIGGVWMSTFINSSAQVYVCCNTGIWAHSSRAGFCCCYDRFLGWGVRIAWLQIWKYGWLTACFWESGTPGSLSMFRSLWHDGLFFLIIVFSETWFERRHCRLICFKCRNTVGNWQSKMAFTMATIQPWFVRCYLSAWFAPSSFPGS